VQIDLPQEAIQVYKSRSQQARVATEAWASENLYCPNCESKTLDQSPPGTPAVDYNCPVCFSPFQLKGQSHRFSARIVDAAYSAMVQAVRENRTPNLFALHYDRSAWQVVDLILIPHFAFPLSAIERRKPLAAAARRHGWVGCNILLSAIPPDARINVILDGKLKPPQEVRKQFARVRPLEKLPVEKRGWTLDVLNAVRSRGKSEFQLSEVYRSDKSLARLHPHNHNIRPKIRQQLQILRDLGLLEFLGGGDYRLT